MVNIKNYGKFHNISAEKLKDDTFMFKLKFDGNKVILKESIVSCCEQNDEFASIILNSTVVLLNKYPHIKETFKKHI